MTTSAHILTESHLTTPGGIPYRTYQGYPKITFKDDGNTATSKILIADESLPALLKELLPPPRIINNQVITEPRGKFPAFPSMVVDSFDVSGHEGNLPSDPFRKDVDGVSTKTYSRVLVVDIKYKTSTLLPYDPYNPETFAEHSVDVSGEIMHIPNANTAGTADAPVESSSYTSASRTGSSPNATTNKDPTMVVTKVVPTIEHNFQWNNVLWPHWTNIIKALGTLNDRKLDWIAKGKTDTVMFMGVSGKRLSIVTEGDDVTPVWNLGLKFLQRVVIDGGETYGWNHVYRPQDGKWVKLLRANDKPLYDATNFLDLFKAEPPAAA